ncbi:ABC transporter ATP-binding protein, partial [Candidatus Bipolaricaulota bacterium]|nr:ABC transporter ATP-binding protein [Candidatus Bipolaricaulota bacterium]
RQLKHIKEPILQLKWKLALMGLLTVIVSFAALAPPYFSKLIFDKGVRANDVGKIIYFGSLTVVFYLTATVLRIGSQVLYARTSNRFVVKVKERALGRLISSPIKFFDKKKSGYWTKRMNEVGSLTQIFSPTVFKFISSLIQFGGAVGVMFVLSRQITYIMLIFLPLFYFVTKTMSEKLRSISRKLMETSAETRGNLQETISGAPEIKKATAGRRKSKELAKQFSAVAKQRVRQSVTSGIGTQTLGLLNKTAGVIVLVLSGVYIARGQLTMGDYVALASYSGKLFVPMQLFGSLALTFQPVMVALKRLAEIFEESSEQELWGDKRVSKLEGKLKLNSLNFSYDESDGQVLRNCNLSIDAGDCVALLGKNGAGKSTLVKLFLGFYPDYSGEILLDGLELHEYDIDSLRKRVGIVSQEVLLFSGTLEENVRLANPEASKESLKQALLRSGFNEVFSQDISNNTISESGRDLSGGQKQVIAIARCLLKDPDILIFDEATTHLDENARKIVVKAFKNKFSGSTRILITQDKELSEIAERTVLLENGELHEKTN